MRILLVEASGRGFLSHYTHALALGMHRLGADVRLLTGKRDELGGWKVPFCKESCLEDGARGWRCIRRQVIVQQPDVVHLQWVDNPLSALRFVGWAQRRGIRVVYTPHNILPHERRWLLMPLYRLLYRRLDRVVARDPHLAWALEEMLDMPRERVVQVSGSPNFLALQADDPSLGKRGTQRRPGERRILFFGHGCPRKGLNFLLEAVAESDWPATMHLVLAGEGVLRGVSEELAAAAARRMRLSVIDRYVEPMDVAALFRDADLLVMPYIKLCKSPLLDLAAALGLPVLRSDRVQGADFHEGVHGITYTHDDTEALCRALKEPDWVHQATRRLAKLDDPVAAMDRLATRHDRLYRQAVANSIEPAETTLVTGRPVSQAR